MSLEELQNCAVELYDLSDRYLHVLIQPLWLGNSTGRSVLQLDPHPYAGAGFTLDIDRLIQLGITL